MRGVEPHEDGSIAGDGGFEARRSAVLDGEDFDGEDIGLGRVATGGFGGSSRLIGGGPVTAGADQQGENGGGGDGSDEQWVW